MHAKSVQTTTKEQKGMKNIELTQTPVLERRAHTVTCRATLYCKGETEKDTTLTTTVWAVRQIMGDEAILVLGFSNILSTTCV